MSDSNEKAEKREDAIKTVMGFFLIMAVVAAIIYEIAAPPERSIPALVGEKVGQFQSARLDTQEDEEAQYLYHTRLGDKQVDALMDYYQRSVDMNAKLVEAAAQWEGKVLDLQAKTLDQGNFVQKFGLNLSDLACGISTLSGDYTYSAACDYSDQMRQGMVNQYPKYLTDSRTGMIETMRNSLPSPGEILDEEYVRSRAMFEASQEEDGAS